MTDDSTASVPYRDLVEQLRDCYVQMPITTFIEAADEIERLRGLADSLEGEGLGGLRLAPSGDGRPHPLIAALRRGQGHDGAPLCPTDVSHPVEALIALADDVAAGQISNHEVTECLRRVAAALAPVLELAAATVAESVASAAVLDAHRVLHAIIEVPPDAKTYIAADRAYEEARRVRIEAGQRLQAARDAVIAQRSDGDPG